MKTKRIIALIFGLSMLANLTACGATDNSKNEAAENNSESEKVSVTELEEKEEKEEKKEETKKESAKKEDTKKEVKSGSIDELKEIIEKDADDTLTALTEEYEALVDEIDTYEKYKSNIDKIKNFYDHANQTNKDLCVRMCEYSLEFAQLIMDSSDDYDKKYDDLEELYDAIYDGACDDMYDEIYDGVLDDIYDDFYDGILDDAYDSVPYNEISPIRSAEYKMWSNARKYTYKNWSDTRSDIYSFWSDLRSAVYKEDADKANKKIEKFTSDLEKFKNKALKSVDSESSDDEDDTTESENSDDTKKDNSSVDSSEVNPEFKKYCDDLEAVVDEYVSFVKKYNDASAEEMISMMDDYSDYMEKYMDAISDLYDVDQDDLSVKDIMYYSEVMGRIEEKTKGI